MNKPIEVPFWQKTFLHVRGLGLNRWKPSSLNKVLSSSLDCG